MRTSTPLSAATCAISRSRSRHSRRCLAIDGQRPLSSRSKRRSGLKIAGGMSMTEAVDQRRAIEWINDAIGEPFRLLQGIDNSLAR
jgi:hypothetical protein